MIDSKIRVFRQSRRIPEVSEIFWAALNFFGTPLALTLCAGRRRQFCPPTGGRWGLQKYEALATAKPLQGGRSDRGAGHIEGRALLGRLSDLRRGVPRSDAAGPTGEPPPDHRTRPWPSHGSVTSHLHPNRCHRRASASAFEHAGDRASPQAREPIRNLVPFYTTQRRPMIPTI